MSYPACSYHMVSVTTYLAHGRPASRSHGFMDTLINAIIRGFGWRIGASAADAFLHLFGVVALVIVGFAVAAYLFSRRHAAGTQPLFRRRSGRR
ncbi:hypothetical protein CCUG60884_00306 [Mycobacteroides salmoniphilum]|uniref:Uncharacterized protein n=1 Tax=Mycobacteroides salmoniphilum TaxID=404941 RepID=A0A4R8SZT5_9MYCO|nr:hypothetical protein CCUG60884_00306 [Mycobacteroides salmoniphilum]